MTHAGPAPYQSALPPPSAPADGLQHGLGHLGHRTLAGFDLSLFQNPVKLARPVEMPPQSLLLILMAPSQPLPDDGELHP